MDINDKYLVRDTKKETIKLKRALESLKLSGTSEVVDEYESKLADFFGSKYALAVSSGSAALHTAMYALGVREDDEVLIPAISPIPTALPLITLKAKLVVVDIEQDSLAFDAEDLKRKISSNTKAAIVVPVWGYPFDYSKTLKVLREYNIPLVEDAAQAHGTKINDRCVGTIGRVGCFSTHDRKILATGEGGFVLTDNKKLYETMKQFSQLGYMDGVNYGLNYKLSSLQAALGTHRIQRIEFQIRARTRNAVLFMKAISDTGLREFFVPCGGKPNYYSLALLLPWSRMRNKKFIQALDSQGIPSDILKYEFQPIYCRQLFKDSKTVCPNAERLISGMTTIPVHPDITEEEILYMADRVVDTVKKMGF